MIDWKRYFDAIYLLTYAGYNGTRISGTIEELKRIGIWNSEIFHVYENIQTPLFYPIIQTMRHETRMSNNSSLFSCTLGHYFIWKICELRRYKRTLIIEDDVVFLNDVGKIRDILETAPNEYDLIMYTHFTGIFDKFSLSGYISQINNAKRENNNFIKLDINGPSIASGGTYAISQNFASILCGLQERYISVSDVIINNSTSPYKDKSSPFCDIVMGYTNRFYCATPISLQKYYGESITESTNPELLRIIIKGSVDMYKSCGINISDYNNYDEFITNIIND